MFIPLNSHPSFLSREGSSLPVAKESLRLYCSHLTDPCVFEGLSPSSDDLVLIVSKREHRNFPYFRPTIGVFDGLCSQRGASYVSLCSPFLLDIPSTFGGVLQTTLTRLPDADKQYSFSGIALCVLGKDAIVNELVSNLHFSKLKPYAKQISLYSKPYIRGLDSQ